MTQFAYFHAGNRPDWATLLPYVFGDKAPAECEMRGPEGLGGHFASLEAGSIRYTPDQQEWYERGDGLWIGMNTARPPHASDLQRPKIVAGSNVDLATYTWHVPRLRCYMAEHGWTTAMPLRMKRVRGQWTSDGVLPEVEALDSLGVELVDRMLMVHNAGLDPDASVGLSWSEAADLVSRVLAVNYRVSADELGMLGALATDDRLGAVLRFATDFDAALAYAKKKTASGA